MSDRSIAWPTCTLPYVPASAMTPERIVSLTKSPSDFANKAQGAVGLTMESISEQDAVSFDLLSHAEFSTFEELNEG
jgi:2-oxo-4-hydroxy-4-carboxy--5-ureidoimidazoline (OHCU) decarboxylase